MTPEMIDNLSTLTDKLIAAHGETTGVAASDLVPRHALCAEPLLNELVFSMLMWESSVVHATKAAERVSAELVDLNELRVCTTDELASILGARMPRGTERASRLIRVLNEIFYRENTLSLFRLGELTKREVQEYLESIDGLPPYASARVILLVLNWHAFPLDDRLAKLLGSKDIITASNTLGQQIAQLERGVRANDALRTYTHIELWAQNQRGASRTRKAHTGRKSTKGISS